MGQEHKFKIIKVEIQIINLFKSYIQTTKNIKNVLLGFKDTPHFKKFILSKLMKIQLMSTLVLLKRM